MKLSKIKDKIKKLEILFFLKRWIIFKLYTLLRRKRQVEVGFKIRIIPYSCLFYLHSFLFMTTHGNIYMVQAISTSNSIVL